MANTALGLTEKQQAMRVEGIGASEVAAVVGLVPGAISVWERKVGRAPEQEASSLSEFGHRIERVIGEAWEERHPGKRIYTPGTLRHPKLAWALASPDRVVAPPGLGRPARETWEQVLEIKTVFFSAADYGEGGTDLVPEKHLVQVAWQLAVTDMQRATLVALVNGDYREFPIVRDLELEGMLFEEVGRWWRDHVIAGTPPPPDGSEAYSTYLRRRYPTNLLPPVDPTPELVDLIEKVRDLKARTKAAETDEEIATSTLKAAIGEAAGVAGFCTWKNNRPTPKTDWEALALTACARAGINADTLIPQFTTNRPGARVLRLQTPKGTR